MLEDWSKFWRLWLLSGALVKFTGAQCFTLEANHSQRSTKPKRTG